MTYCTYITVHEPTGKFYIGKGVTSAVNLGKYQGSGIKLKKTMKKYPDGWKTSVLWEFATSDEAYSDEGGIVTEELLKDPLCLNLVTGGIGHDNAGKKNPFFGKFHSEETRRKYSETRKGFKRPESANEAARLKNTGRVMPLISCLYCKTVGSIATMPRWHLVNCKERK
jgi:hypothetical protein